MSNPTNTTNIVQALPLPPVFYHARETSYWRMDENNRWIKVNDASAKSFIAEHAYSKKPTTPGSNSEVEKCIMDIQAKQNVAYVGPLAGHCAGVYRMGDNQILVTDSPKFITPKLVNGVRWKPCSVACSLTVNSTNAHTSTVG